MTLKEKYEIGGMTYKRYGELFDDINLDLTLEEKEAGWYFSDEFDGLLIHKSWPEADFDWGTYHSLQCGETQVAL